MHLVSRRTFVATTAAVGGGLLLGFRLPPLEPNDLFAPNAFVRIDRDGRVTLIMHKVEMGQGTYTSMPMLLAEELEVELSQVQLEHAPPDDARYAEPLFGVQETGGSTSVRGNWEPLRRAGADRKSTRLNSSHGYISYAVFCLKKKTNTKCSLFLAQSVTRTGLSQFSRVRTDIGELLTVIHRYLVELRSPMSAWTRHLLTSAAA